MLNEPCIKCLKPAPLCICEFLKPQANKRFVLILQHPQEPDKILGSAPLVTGILKNSFLRVALSRPNLAAALKDSGWSGHIDPKQWGVLYMGTGLTKPRATDSPLYRYDARKKALESMGDSKQLPMPSGLVILDGTWSQAKALWWRNPWLLKLQRLVLIPKRPSLYGTLRKEPKREALSSLEATAFALTAIGEPASTEAALMEAFSGFVAKARAAGVKKGMLPHTPPV